MYENSHQIPGREFIGKFASIQTCDNRTQEGFIYVVDPESGAVVLTTKSTRQTSTDQTSSELKIIIASSIRSIHIDETQDIGEIDLFTTENTPTYSTTVLQKRKQKLKEWLRLNLIEVVDDGEALKFQDHLIIEPPYDLEHCYCTNTIVLDRFKNLIEKMPDS